MFFNLKNEKYQLKKNTCILYDKNRNAKVFEKNKNLTAHFNKDAMFVVEMLNSGLSKKQIIQNITKRYKSEKSLIGQKYDEIINTLKTYDLIQDFKNADTPYYIRYTECDKPIINLQVAVTGKCNLKCKHCYDYSESEQLREQLTLEKINDIILQAKSLGVVQFDITGGEPLLREDIFSIAGLLKEHGFEMGLFTNATLLTEEKIEQLSNLEINEYRISLDGYEKNHNQFRGVNNAYAKTKKALDYIKEKTNSSIIVNVLINSLNKNEIAAFLNDLITQKLRYKIDTIIPKGNAVNNQELILTIDEYIEAISEIFGRESDYYKDNVNKLSINGIKSKHINGSNLGCGVGNKILFIDSKGDIKYCPTLPQILGNIHKDKIKDVWENITEEQRKQLQCKHINQCVYSLICGGGCRSRAFELSGEHDSPDVYECRLLEKIFGLDSCCQNINQEKLNNEIM